MQHTTVCVYYVSTIYVNNTIVYVEAQYPLDNYCSHYKAMSMLPTKMDSYIKIIGNTQHSYVSIVYWTIEIHYIITNVMYSMHVKIISPRQRLGLWHFPHHFSHVSTHFMINNLVIIKLTYKLYISCMVYCSSTRSMYAPAIICNNISDRLRSARVNIMKRSDSMNILLHENLQYKCDNMGQRSL